MSTVRISEEDLPLLRRIESALKDCLTSVGAATLRLRKTKEDADKAINKAEAEVAAECTKVRAKEEELSKTLEVLLAKQEIDITKVRSVSTATGEVHFG
jgi:hypothetical protein